jgi:preprotein translocase subunit SecF
MYDLVGKRKWYYLASAILIIPGIIVMIYATVTTGSPLRLSIDFTGGVIWEMQFPQAVQPANVRAVFVEKGLTDTSVTTVGDDRTVQVRLKAIEDQAKSELSELLETRFGGMEELQFRSVGPTVGREVTRSAGVAIAVASLAILIFISWAFRNVPHPVRFGLCAILAMLHDVLLIMGFLAIMGYVAGWEVDALFLTAVLTLIGFAVQDAIVVFDRIRENIPKHRGESFEVVANRSLLETLHRSLVTQLNAMFIMIAILIFGGATIKQFIAAMLLGLLSGTYSSIFNAVPLLVSWENGEIGGFFRRLVGRRAAA